MDSHQTCVNTIKCLAMDAIQKANSGHPGMPVGTAGVASVLWRRFLKHDPAHPDWPDRDRFVLSAGHGSMLLYSLLHLAGYDLGLDDIQAFRQWGSRTPGHPEHGHTAGVETTTGPLGQGLSNAVGMALAERYLREHFGADLVDHRTWCIAGDGCLMEGLSSEAGSLAGHLGLGRLVVLWDDNHITIDGETEITFSEDVLLRFEAFGWHTLRIDGHDPELIAHALRAAVAETGRPSLIAARTHIAHGTAKQDSNTSHGSPLGDEVIAAAKRDMGWDPAARFVVPDEARAAFREHDGPERYQQWCQRLEAHPRREELEAWIRGDGAALVDAVEWPSFEVGGKLATRKASAACLKAITAATGQVLGGSADLSGSNGTRVGLPWLERDGWSGGRSIAFGVREHAMAGICNGLALHGGLIPYCATFLVFHDYMRPSVRLACLMGQRVVYVYTHDSVFLGEDGPTHQPVETLLALRTIPGMRVLRPADAAETVEAWKHALQREDGPTALVLTRQGLPILDRTELPPASELHRGAYVLAGQPTGAEVVILATGSEVALALEVRAELASEVEVMVVSMPCRELLDDQDTDHRHSVLPPGVPRVSLEAGVTLGWERWLGEGGLAIGIDRFGASAPPAEIAEHYGFTAPQVAQRVRELLA